MIGIVFLLNIEYAPFLEKYTRELEIGGIKYEIITWDRLESNHKTNWNQISYKKKSNLNDSKIKKMFSFWGFRRFLLRTLRLKKYEKLIILTTLTGMLIGDYLIKEYNGKFIFDIRDYTFENNSLFKFFESKLINASKFTAISSEGFKGFLPNSNKYILSHNILKDEIISSAKFNKVNKSGKINISFIGAVRHFDNDKKVVDIFGRDNRFDVYFHGYGVTYNRLKNYCDSKFNNLYLTGKYDRKDKMKLLENSTVINSYYSSEVYANKFAMPNKYYDTLIYRIPLWANPKVYVGQRAIEKGIGINVILNDEAPDKICSIFNNFNWAEFNENCEKELGVVLREDQIFIQKVKEFIE